MVRTSAFQADNPGSNPGRRILSLTINVGLHEIQKIQAIQRREQGDSQGKGADTKIHDRKKAGVCGQIREAY